MSHLTQEQRYIMENEYRNGRKQKDIAILIGKDKSVVSREISRNCDGRTGQYRAELAQKKYTNRKREKPHCERLTKAMKVIILKLLKQKFSPEQITGHCKKQGWPMVSPESIYRYIWENKRKGGKLYKHLRTKGKKYKSRGCVNERRGQIIGRKGIEERPPEVEKRQRLGDLEIDTIVGKDHKGAIVTINDRATGQLWMKKLESKDALKLAHATIEILKDYQPFIKTITADNGKEFAAHQIISNELDINFYFAKPYASWQRGSNENLNGLIRQYIPKKTDFSTLTDYEIQRIQDELNNRPRKRYNFESPKTMFNKKVAFAG